VAIFVFLFFVVNGKIISLIRHSGDPSDRGCFAVGLSGWFFSLDIVRRCGDFGYQIWQATLFGQLFFKFD